MPSPHDAPAELLASLAGALSRLGVPWYVFGAQAAIIWGRPRLTADVDVTVRLHPHDPARLVRVLSEDGFALREEAGEDFVRTTRVVPFVHTATQLPVDIVLAGPGLEEDFLSRAIEVRIGGAGVPVISPEDLIATKILAARAKDIEDVRGVLRERLETLDVELVGSTLALLQDALGRSDLQPAFERELDEARHAAETREEGGENRANAPRVTVKWEDLELAFDFVSSGDPLEHAAYVSLDTGEIYWDVEDEELPADLDEGNYLRVPHKNDLDLGRRLVMRFADAVLPGRADDIELCFRRRGAYGRFKRILEQEGKLDAWYEFEARATNEALREWCEEHDLRIERGSSDAEPPYRR